MKRLLVVVFAALLVAGNARADVALIDYLGYSYETGGFPPSAPGDVLMIVGVVDSLDSRFGINLLTHEVTLVASGLVSGGQVDVGGGVLSIAYTGGGLDLYDDPSMDHDYGVNPPNGTVPSTFSNGTLFLGGTFDNFFLFYDLATGTGAYEGYLSFTAGTGLAALSQINSPGYTFGGLLSRTAAPGTNIPAGYDLQVDGVLQVGPFIAVKPMSWGAVKEMYRQ
jgi:hypothetical protein